MRKVFSPLVVVLLIAGLSATGCATKTYVDEQVQATEERTGTKIADVQSSVEENQQQIGDLKAADEQIRKDLEKLSETAKDALDRAQKAHKLAKGEFLYEVTLTDQDVKFGFDRYQLSDEAKAALDDFAMKVKDMGKDKGNLYVEVQGHTDNIGSEKYNLELGYKRAEQVMRYLNMEQDFPLHRMNVISYGEYKPMVDNDSRENRSKNRRVTLVVLE